MRLCHLWRKHLARGAWVTLLACSAAQASCGEVKLSAPDAASPGPVDARPGAPDAGHPPDARPGPDAPSPPPDAQRPPDAQPDCAEADLGSALGNTLYTGTTVGAPDREVSCGNGEDDGEGSGDVYLQWTAPAAGRYLIDTCGSTYDTILSARANNCSGQDLACNDDSEACDMESKQSRIVLDLAQGQRVLLIVDGYEAEGPFQINIAQAP
jgi:hypothetical protein